MLHHGGLGAVLIWAGRVLSYFSSRVSEEDCQILDIQHGCNTAQQVLEALAALVALRTWCPLWVNRRISLNMKTDNMTALALVQTLKAKGPSLATIARDMSLDMGTSAYEPDIVEHLPGVMNKCADELSREFEPDRKFTLPPVLSNATRSHPPLRTRCWWKALPPTTSSSIQVGVGRSLNTCLFILLARILGKR